jgi:rRNA processing protein Gar1
MSQSFANNEYEIELGDYEWANLCQIGTPVLDHRGNNIGYIARVFTRGGVWFAVVKMQDDYVIREKNTTRFEHQIAIQVDQNIMHQGLPRKL